MQGRNMTGQNSKREMELHDPPAAAAAPVGEPESFVINLCSSTTPMALTQSRPAELKRYKFFVSRRLEDGRERFRLHMGYFDSMLQAEELLPLVRDIYPGAWAGETPGKRLRARAAAADLSAQAAPPMDAPAVEVPATDATATDATAIDASPMAAPAELELLENAPTLTPDVDPAPVAPPALAAPTAADADNGRTGKAKRNAKLPFDQRSNVREVLKSLDESAKPGATMPESQVLTLLEEQRGAPLNTASAPAAYAVQLKWSVQRIDMASVPPLAIFGAYTLYSVEGSREGRRWYGLRLGFFKDANAAKQVAQYVRSEFTAVAVVPVTAKERDGASGATAVTGAVPPPNAPLERLPADSAEFKLLDDAAETPKVSAALTAALDGPPAAKTVKRRSHRVNAREKRSAKSLEETLEILGADELQIEGSKRKSLCDSAARTQEVKQKNSPFTRLLERLAERNR
jgi:hypothetical protein